MIPIPSGWCARRIEEVHSFTPPGGAAHGLLRYVERRRPLRATRELVAALGAPVGYVAEHDLAPERLVTDEGEHGAFVASRGRLHGRPMGMSIGFVFLDDAYASLTGIAYDDDIPAMEAQVRALIALDTHLLGRVRRRRFGYAIPPGWLATGDEFDARLYPPTHPADPSRILVGAALPATPGLCEHTVARLAGARTVVAVPISHPRLEARGFAITGGPLEATLVFLEDERFLYSVRMDAPPGAHAAVLDALIASVEPVPAPIAPIVTSTALAHWAE